LAIEYIAKQKKPAATDIVVLHNAANPLFTDDEIKKVIKDKNLEDDTVVVIAGALGEEFCVHGFVGH
jgi:2-C-methyl-D-erythritol 4-phosphate cytidylyltransferase